MQVIDAPVARAVPGQEMVPTVPVPPVVKESVTVTPVSGTLPVFVTTKR